jgi:hypothetical protein
VRYGVLSGAIALGGLIFALMLFSNASGFTSVPDDVARQMTGGINCSWNVNAGTCTAFDPDNCNAGAAGWRQAQKGDPGQVWGTLNNGTQGWPCGVIECGKVYRANGGCPPP